MKFSQRIGKKEIRTQLQIGAIDTDLLNRLWNVIIEDFFGKLNDRSRFYSQIQKKEVCEIIWKEFFKRTIDTIPSSYSEVDVESVIGYIRSWFFDKAEWFEIYDLIEFLSTIDQVLQIGFVIECNKALKKEVAGYRIVNNQILQITSEEEIQEIEQSFSNTSKWDSVSTHLKTALDNLTSRKSPNYRNSIKESISAVESLCKIITKDNNATLGKALIEIEKKNNLHKALKTAFSSLYGYTSDSGGIRHALIEADVEVDFEEAKFMLVSCSAFINYLKSKVKL